MFVPALLLPGLGGGELLIILIIVLVIFGPKRLPQMGKALGDTIKELRSSAKGEKESEEQSGEKKEPVAAKQTEDPTT